MTPARPRAADMGTPLQAPREFPHGGNRLLMLPLTLPRALRAGATVTPRLGDRLLRCFHARSESA